MAPNRCELKSPDLLIAFSDSAFSAVTHRHFQDTGIWRDAPVYKGATKFPPLEDAKNILITGGAGFMFVSLFVLLNCFIFVSRGFPSGSELIMD